MSASASQTGLLARGGATSSTVSPAKPSIPSAILFDMNLSSYTLGIAPPPKITWPPKKTMIADIQQKTAEYFGIPVIEMTSARRHRGVARPRQVAMYLSKQLTPLSLPEIGRRFGKRDHTTVIHAIKTVERLCHEDPYMAEDVAIIRTYFDEIAAA
jgi:hypothetical protein